MKVNNAKEVAETVLVLLDRLHPGFDGPEVVSQVKLAGRLDSTERSHGPPAAPSLVVELKTGGSDGETGVSQSWQFGARSTKG